MSHNKRVGHRVCSNCHLWFPRIYCLQSFTNDYLWVKSNISLLWKVMFYGTTFLCVLSTPASETEKQRYIVVTRTVRMTSRAWSIYCPALHRGPGAVLVIHPVLKLGHCLRVLKWEEKSTKVWIPVVSPRACSVNQWPLCCPYKVSICCAHGAPLSPLVIPQKLCGQMPFLHTVLQARVLWALSASLSWFLLILHEQLSSERWSLE